MRARSARRCGTRARNARCGPLTRFAVQQGTITFKNLKRVAKELGENMTDEELQEMIDEADRDGDGEVNEEVRTARARLLPVPLPLRCVCGASRPGVCVLQEFIRIMRKTALVRLPSRLEIAAHSC